MFRGFYCPDSRANRNYPLRRSVISKSNTKTEKVRFSSKFRAKFRAKLIIALVISLAIFLPLSLHIESQGQYSQDRQSQQEPYQQAPQTYRTGELRILDEPDEQLSAVPAKTGVKGNDIEVSEVSRSGPCKDGRELILESTAYTWTGNRTATGTWPRQGRTVAVNPATIPFHSKIYIEGVGWRVAEDRIPEESIEKGAQVDIYMDRESDCWDWGRRDVRVRVVEPQ